MKIASRDNDNYYPQPESLGGWRFLKDSREIKSLTNVSLGKLDDLIQKYRFFFDTHASGVVIIRNGYVIKEHYSFMTLPGSRFDVWSCTKSFTGTAWGLLLEESRKGILPNNLKIDLDSCAYSFLSEKYKVTDKLKEKITIGHLLTMTSGIAGENDLVFGVPTEIDCGPFENALGYCDNRYGRKTDKLVSEPGKLWNYSDPAMAHLSILFHSIMDREMHVYMQEKVFMEIGIENASWDVLGGGQFIGPHTSAHIGLHISARELARFGYLLMHQGLWNGKEVIPSWWVETATKSSQQLNPEYGYTFWVNTNGTHWPGLPKDMFALEGYNSNRCYVVPSQDLVLVRVGAGPNQWNEQLLIGSVLDALN
jgi:CubicO group peptidase (beta-lactamase class C family)